MQALARRPDQLENTPGLIVRKGDACDADAVNKSMHAAPTQIAEPLHLAGIGQAGAMPDRSAVDAVIVAVGMPPTMRATTLFSQVLGNVISAMTGAGVTRLLYITGVGAGDSRGHGGFIYDHLLLPLLLARVYEDKDRSENLLRASALRWTIVRPGFLTNGPTTGRYRILTHLSHVVASDISRGDVAHFVLDELERNEFVGKTPLLSY